MTCPSCKIDGCPRFVEFRDCEDEDKRYKQYVPNFIFPAKED
tara:strand:- start:173 stop:298 length:126 start_codon:yes stop_codon:yes gene_type:complete